MAIKGSIGNLTLILILSKGYLSKVISKLDALDIGNQEAIEFPKILIDEIELEPI